MGIISYAFAVKTITITRDSKGENGGHCGEAVKPARDRHPYEPLRVKFRDCRQTGEPLTGILANSS